MVLLLNRKHYRYKMIKSSHLNIQPIIKELEIEKVS